MLRIRTLWSCLLVVAGLFLTASALQLAGQSPAAIVFEGARLLTGDGSTPIENSAFIVQNDRFTRVGRRGEMAVPDPPASTSPARP
jgi:hypothetical protein